MRVTRDMVHEDLQPYYNRLRGFEAVIKYRWLSKLANGLLKRAVAGKNRDTLNCNEVYIPSSDGRWRINRCNKIVHCRFLFTFMVVAMSWEPQRYQQMC